MNTGTQTISFGPAEPPSIPGYPVVHQGEDPWGMAPCALYYGEGNPVATINGNVVATERVSLSGVKALFD